MVLAMASPERVSRVAGRKMRSGALSLPMARESVIVRVVGA